MSWNHFGALRPALFVALVGLLPGRASAQPDPPVSFADSAELLVIEAQPALDQHTTESLERALPLLHRALAQLGRPEHRGRAATVLNDIGSAHVGLGRTDSALVYFVRALEARRHPDVNDVYGAANTIHNIGVIYYDRGRPDTALVYYRSALDLYHRLGDLAGEAKVLGAMGNAFQKLTHADSAFAYLSRARELAQGLPDRRVLAQTLASIGHVHCTLQRTDSAEHYLSQARRIQVEVGDMRGRVGTDAARECLRSAEPANSALARLHQLLLDTRQVADPFSRANVLDEIGTVHRRLGHADSALAYYARALEIQRGLGDERAVGATLTHVAVVHAEANRPDSALAYYASALPLLRGANDPREEGAALINMGVLHHRTLTPASLARAVAYYDSADAVLARVVRSAGGDQGWVSFAEIHASLFDSWALAWLERNGQVGARRAEYAALAAGERGRAQALRDLMMRRGGAEQGQPAGLAHTGPGKDLPAEGRALVAQLRRSGVPAVAYMVTSSTLITFLVRDGKVEAFTTVVRPDAIAAVVRELRDALKVNDSDAWRAPAVWLADLLLPRRLFENLPESGELVIVPSGPLFLLPFAALPLPGGSDADAFLGLRYAIRYAPSLQVLASLEGETDETRLMENALVVGNPTMPWVGDRDTGLYPSSLDHAEKEAEWVAGRVRAGVLLGPNATEGAVRERMGSATLIHLATHGHAYPRADSARDSYVVLATGPGDNGPDNDGLLTVGEVLDAVPSMRAELVVLSACVTGLGNVTRTEGTVGLQRAFLARGARGVLVSLWSVQDESTSLLMQGFYKEWLEDTPAGQTHRAEALRLAQLQLFRSDRFAHPHYWAAFQLVGAR